MIDHSMRGHGNRDALLAQAWIICGLSWFYGDESMTGRILRDGDFWWPLYLFTALWLACAAETYSRRWVAWPRWLSSALWKSFGMALACQAIVFGVLSGWGLAPIWTGYSWLSANSIRLGVRIARGDL